ncbi:MAG: hypothetical protein ACTSWE_08215 [Promethearchaeota archaeon]
MASPNATGKSSFIKALRLLTFSGDEFVLESLLNSSSLNGSITLKSKEIYHVSLKRFENKVLVDSNSKFLLRDPRIGEIAFLTNDNPFMQNIEKGINIDIINSWLSEITDLQYYKKAFSINSKIGSEYQRELEKILSEVKIKESSLNILIEDYKKEKKELETRLANLRAKSSSNVDLKEYREKHTKIAREIESLKNKIKNNSSRLDQAKYDIRLTKDEIHELSKALNETINQFENAEIEIKRKESTISKLEIEIDKKEELLFNRRDELNRFRTIKTEIERSLDKDESKCSFCNSKIDKGSLKEYLKEIQSKIKKLANEIDGISSELNRLALEKRAIFDEIQSFRTSLPKKKRQLEIRLRDSENQLSRLESIIRTYPEKLLEDRKILQDKEVEYNKIQQILVDLTSTDDSSKKTQNELIIKIDELAKKISDIELQLYKMKFSNQRITSLNRLLDGVRQISNFIQDKIIFIQDKLIDRINERISECFNDLHFLDFSSIYLTDELTLEIKRKPGITTPFSELSTMERTLIGIIIAFSVLKAFYPDFPIFAIDDPLNAADDLRFQRLVKYLSTKIPLLVVTRNIAKDDSELKLLTQENILVEI